ncbi:unnamed protein product [Microthlaspi erraticum]|uniref:Uncharacterized protein n=1 Tax=Microthlaspi erraticum TaxID=1685480 RepID=A0A6D2K3S0_9BRAS|nr:unnamed protein product [Microthlaspi erraticum]CAA7043213.1 unnamed protein product [Microthlaspi erraticum]CAA7048631.1 unnamed protein product [Microthlaspi erraticum]CAA7056949.1 unnamed protein product [Microthlaspi erraticum]
MAIQDFPTLSSLDSGFANNWFLKYPASQFHGGESRFLPLTSSHTRRLCLPLGSNFCRKLQSWYQDIRRE